MTISEILTMGLLFISPVLAQEEKKEASAECLAMNMYHEARDQGVAGQLAVSLVVFNRIKDPRFPNTPCQVVYQGPVRESWKTRKTPDPLDSVFYPIKNRCQFSWYCDGKSDTPHDKKTYNRLIDIAEGMLGGSYSLIDITDGATFYHADYVTPGWAKTKIRTIEIQDHIFYRWETKKDGTK